jgi:hypothetical protein
VCARAHTHTQTSVRMCGRTHTQKHTHTHWCRSTATHGTVSAARLAHTHLLKLADTSMRQELACIRHAYHCTCGRLYRVYSSGVSICTFVLVKQVNSVPTSSMPLKSGSGSASGISVQPRIATSAPAYAGLKLRIALGT